MPPPPPTQPAPPWGCLPAGSPMGQMIGRLGPLLLDAHSRLSRRGGTAGNNWERNARNALETTVGPSLQASHPAWTLTAKRDPQTLRRILPEEKVMPAVPFIRTFPRGSQRPRRMGGVTFTTVFHMPSYWAKLGQYPRQRLRGRDPSWGTGAHSRPLKQDQGAASPTEAQ